MKNKVLLILCFLFLTLTFSCTKEKVSPSQTDLIEAELKQVIGSNNVRVIALDYNQPFPNSFSSSLGTSYSFSNGFINIAGYTQTFNLAYLKSYELANIIVDTGNGNTSSEPALLLFFE